MMVELAGNEAGLVADWELNEGTDTTAGDQSPAHHTASLVNNPAWAAGGPLP
jgi:hypothetical protein